MQYDRIIPLKNLSSYVHNDFLDMVFYLPVTKGINLRIWLYTKSKNPKICIDDDEFNVKEEIISDKNRWLDFGITDKLQGGFGQLKIIGIEMGEAQDSYLLITAQIDKILKGDLEDVEKDIFGISCKDAGTTMITPSRVPCGEKVTFKVLYKTGEKGLPKGSRIRFTVPYSYPIPQNKNKNEIGYVDILQGSNLIEIESIAISTVSHEIVDIICLLKEHMNTDDEILISYKTDYTYIYNCQHKENGILYWYTKIPPLNATVAVDDRKLFVPLLDTNSHSVEFIPRKSERMHLFLPGQIRKNKEIILKGIITDKYRNVPPESTIDLRCKFYIKQNDKKIELDKKCLVFDDFYRFHFKIIDLDEGVYRIIAVDNNENIVATSNPMKIVNENEKEIYFGEIHVHTQMSDGIGDYNYLYEHAKNVACLDFAAASDHACYFSDNQWNIMQDITNKWNKDDEFVTLNGYEWAGRQIHRNIYTSKDRLKLFRGMYEPTSNINVVWDYFKDNKDVVGGPHAPLAHGLIWKYHEPKVERFVEMYSMWGANDFKENPLRPLYLNKNSISVNELLKQGEHLGFTGGGDCHEGRASFSCESVGNQGKTPHTFARNIPYKCGISAAVSDELTRKSIIKCLRDRKTYATTGARILIDFSINENEMGSIIKGKTVNLVTEVHACDIIKEIRIINDGKIVYRVNPYKEDFDFAWNESIKVNEEQYYYVQAIQEDGEMGWSSPIWVKPE